ncbi:MAG: translation initiation factor IF-2, partial [Bacteroidota bacterium]
MPKRLVKIAKELNVGTTTIVDYLSSIGFEIENKPTAKVSDEMIDELMKEYSSSMSVKEKADQLVIGSRVERDAPPTPPTPVVKEEPKEVTPEPVAEEPVQEEAPAPVEEVEVPKEVKEEEVVEEKEKPKLKVIGKIDLDAQKKKPKAKKEEVPEEKVEEKVEAKKTEKEAKPVEDTKEEEGKAPAKEEPKEKGEEILRAKTPQLKGLKILGKIDTNRLKEPKKKKPEKKQEGKKAPVASSDNTQKKRKRKRKKVFAKADVSRNNRNQQRGSKRDEVKEVSQKEIDDKIKATMARLAGKGKNRRQKIRRDKRESIREKQEIAEAQKETGKLALTEFVTVSELASLMNVSVTEVITTCMNLGVIVSINQRLDAEIIELVADEFDHEVEFTSAEDLVDTEEVIEDDPEDLVPRAPIVTVMGHVDHGKTSLLDYIRSAKVAEGEAGGITQHIGAYEVDVNGKKITFLDTPGHEAFTAMRARGAKVTDVVVVIVAADDKIMPQTKEAISHSQAAGVPIVFAINKIDKPGADPDRIKTELSSMNFLVEEWGGKYQSQDISAKTGDNIDQLLEKIALEAELLELKANPDREASGTVIEASLDKGRGYVTKILVQNGTLKIGDPVVAGQYSGKIKAMYNEKGSRVKTAGPSAPVLVLGLSGAPQAGEKFKVAASEQEARQLATKRSQIAREQTNRASKRVSLDEIGRRLALGTFKELNLIVKGDVDGSVEALSDSLIKQSIETVQVNVIHKAVGQIIESDVLLASASDAIIIGFQVRPSMGARKLAEKEGIQIKMYSIIYEAIEEIRAAIEGMLEPTKEEKITAQVRVRETYKISKVGTIAGCYVEDGKISRNSLIRIIRDGIVVYPTKEGATAELASLKRFKDDAKEVKNGLECGLSVKNFNDIKVGDVIEGYEIIEVAQ